MYSLHPPTRAYLLINDGLFASQDEANDAQDDNNTSDEELCVARPMPCSEKTRLRAASMSSGEKTTRVQKGEVEKNRFAYSDDN